MTTRYMISEPYGRLEDKDMIRAGVDNYNMDITGERDYRPLAVFLRDEAGAIQGGILGDMWGGWLHVTYLWVAEAVRHQGHGRQLLAAAESEARQHGCHQVYLETYSFQAPPFYEQAGYTLVGSIGDFPPGHNYYIFKKSLG